MPFYIILIWLRQYGKRCWRNVCILNSRQLLYYIVDSLEKGVSVIKERERKKEIDDIFFMGISEQREWQQWWFRLSSFCMQYRKMSRERKEHTFVTFPFTFFALLPSFALITLLDFSNKSFLLLYPFSFTSPTFTFHIHSKIISYTKSKTKEKNQTNST